MCELYFQCLKSRVFYKWAGAATSGLLHAAHLKLRLDVIFGGYSRRALLQRAFGRWRAAAFPPDMSGFYDYMLKWRALQAFQLWRDARRLLLGAVVGMKELSSGLEALKRKSILAWRASARDAAAGTHLVSESFGRLEAHRCFLAWREYLRGLADGFDLHPRLTRRRDPTRGAGPGGGGPKQEAVLARQFKSAAVWESAVACFRRWATVSLPEYIPGDEPPAAPPVRMIRLVHLGWALEAGRAAWRQGFSDADAVWRSLQLWKKAACEEQRRRQHAQEELAQRLRIAQQWFDSRLAWKAFQGWTRVANAARVAKNLHEQAKLQMHLALREWRILVAGRRSMQSRAERMAARREFGLKQTLFRHWRSWAEQSSLGSRLQTLVRELEAELDAAHEENDSSSEEFKKLYGKIRDDVDQAHRENLAMKRMYEDQFRTTQLYEDLLQQAKRQVERLQQRCELAEAEATTANGRVAKMATAAQLETECYDSLLEKLDGIRKHQMECRAAFNRDLWPNGAARKDMSGNTDLANQQSWEKDFKSGAPRAAVSGNSVHFDTPDNKPFWPGSGLSNFDAKTDDIFKDTSYETECCCRKICDVDDCNSSFKYPPLSRKGSYCLSSSPCSSDNEDVLQYIW